MPRAMWIHSVALPVHQDALTDEHIMFANVGIASSKQGLNTFLQYFYAERLGNIIVGPHGKAHQLVGLL